MKCRTCGTTLSAGALLCGECGTSAIAPRPTLGDTARYDRKALLDTILREQRRVAAAAPGGASAPPTGRIPDPATAAAPGHLADPPTVATPIQRTAESPAAAPTPTSTDTDTDRGPEHPPLHPPRHAAPPVHRPRALFSLVFSTGESIRVSGSGLVGRNPTPAAGERFDYLVQIVDPQRSVSKTHLAFGVEEGELWVADRGSSNGTRLGLDLVDPIELTAGERIRVPRGTRIGIGDQYFDVH